MCTTPERLTDEHLEYLDELRESRITSMYGASPYLQKEYPKLSQEDARAILVHWMNTFSERHNP